MSSGCLTEVDLYRAFREEMPAEESRVALHHVLGCALCHEQWQRFVLDEQMAAGIRSAVRGDARGADEAPGVSTAMELPERLHIPGFRLRGDFIDGGQARVYHAVHEASQEEVAIKVFHNSPLNEGGYARFSAELQSLARLRHPNVIPIRSAGEILGHAYYVMPWIEGLPLDEYVKQHKPTPRECVDLMIKICAAVDHAHKRGVMHLDLKPSNVRVDAGGEPLVMDFGLARASQQGADVDVRVALGVAGTPAYMAPEQVRDREDVDTRADVFMLGLLLFEVLTGRRARQSRLDAGGAGSDLALEAPPSIRSLLPRINSELAAIVGMATAMARERRYPTAEALLDDLRQYRTGRPVIAMGESALYRFRKLSRRHLAVAVGVLAILGILGFALVVSRETQRMAEQSYLLASEVAKGRFLATERSLARAYAELADAYTRLGEDREAEEYAIRAQATLIRVKSYETARPINAER